MKNLWFLMLPTAFFALVLVSACTPDVQIYQQSDGGREPEPYIDPGNYTNQNADMYGTWYHMGTGTTIASSEPESAIHGPLFETMDAGPVAPPLAKWKLTLNRDNTWALAFFLYTAEDDEALDGDEALVQNSIMVPNAASGPVADPPSGYGETGGYTLFHFLASGNYFVFNGTDQITFTINSTASRPVLNPPERLIVTIAETAGAAAKPVNKYDFVPKEETAIRFGTIIRIDEAFEGEWERR